MQNSCSINHGGYCHGSISQAQQSDRYIERDMNIIESNWEYCSVHHLLIGKCVDKVMLKL